MPRGPRPIATVAKTVLEAIESELEATDTEFFKVYIGIQANNAPEALAALHEIVRVRNLLIKVLAFTRVNRMTEAQDVIMEIKLRRKGENRG
jgi:nitrate reductase NapAB chaperone NapD